MSICFKLKEKGWSCHHQLCRYKKWSCDFSITRIQETILFSFYNKCCAKPVAKCSSTVILCQNRIFVFFCIFNVTTLVVLSILEKPQTNCNKKKMKYRIYGYIMRRILPRFFIIINRNNVFHSYPDREITCLPCFFVYYCQHAKLNISSYENTNKTQHI